MKDQFVVPKQQIYLVGNSLGAMPRAVAQRMSHVLEQQWAQDGSLSWTEASWAGLARRVGDKIAALVGAQPREVIASDSTSLNLYKLIHQALVLRPQRREILIEQDAFPTDSYVAQGIARQHGLTLRVCTPDDLPQLIGSETAVAVLGHVNYLTGRCWDMAALTAQCHAAGALVLWDVAHSAGALPLALSECGADFAVGCGYKFLNGGPGAPAFAYVAQRHHAQLQPVIQGWFGHARPFAFEPDYEPAADVDALQVGTPGILGLSALDTALDVFAQTDIVYLHAQAQDMLDSLMQAFAQRPELQDFRVLTPEQRDQRGNQFSFSHPQAQAIGNALLEQGVVGGFRPPQILRWGLAAPYLDAQDIAAALKILERIMRDGLWREPRFQQSQSVS